MRKLPLIVALVATASCVALSTPADARDLGDGPWAKERFQVRLRGIDVLPDEDADVNIGGELKAENAFVPEVDLTYFFTPHIAAELIAATSKHDIKYEGSALGDAWILPPTLTLQYHFTPDNKFSPYLGAGVNYSIFYAEDAATGFHDLDIGNGVGFALQAGSDYWINDHWGVNLDVKKLWLNIDASVNTGAVTADIDLDPWIIGAGVSYRF